MLKKGIFILAAMFMLTGASTFAQAPTFAHIDYLAVLDSLPSYKSAERQLQLEVENSQKSMSDKQIELQRKVEEFEAQKDSLHKMIREKREQALNEDLQLLQVQMQNEEQRLQQLQVEMFADIEKNLKKSVANVAERHKVTYVLEASSLLFVGEGGLDLTKEVRDEMLKLENQE